MISVQGLTKSYGATDAVRDLSFSVDRGEVVGFLGPNGAGKSTTMKILSGYLPADAGEVRIAGFDILSQSLKARSRIGYLPENVPLYPEMRVGEYLRYRAALKGVRSRRITEKVEDALELCTISHVRNQLIGTLSKGYRQRVGLADALVNEPDILILDEPTIGLDPGQIREVRELIKGLAKRHTILLSSHILSEVEMTCSRVLIINKGHIVATGTPAELRERSGIALSGSVRMEIQTADRANSEAVLAILQSLEEVASASLAEGIPSSTNSTSSWTRYEIIPSLSSSSSGDPRPALFEEAVRRGWKLRELSAHESSLEEIFTSFVDRIPGTPERKTSTKEPAKL
ncbi:MAG: ABC transporter ATP-binding protein [Verrucomicrobia bacterium]|nr:ABC transporter ATP-binding protein [Verrucomicrobiota bacterium]